MPKGSLWNTENLSFFFAFCYKNELIPVNFLALSSKAPVSHKFFFCVYVGPKLELPVSHKVFGV